MIYSDYPVIEIKWTGFCIICLVRNHICVATGMVATLRKPIKPGVRILGIDKLLRSVPYTITNSFKIYAE